MRIGITVAETGGDQALVKLADQLRRAADDGLASAWMSNIFGLDALISLAVAGSQVPGIELGTAVVPTYPRHPAVMAQQALTVALAIGPGRLNLGIGLSHKIVIEDMYGYSFGQAGPAHARVPVGPAAAARRHRRQRRRQHAERAHRPVGAPGRAGSRCCWRRWPRACCSWPASRPTARCCG